jgi:U3 small nucleolar RNA-associated protein 10
MVSSLAAQLAQGASLNAPILSETQRRRHANVSYLFATSKQGSDDLDALHAVAQNAFAQLLQLTPALADVEDQLFSQKAREMDRTLLRKSEVDALDEAIGKCLKLVGPSLMEDVVGRVIEWLVKRFRCAPSHWNLIHALKLLSHRINEFNVSQILSVFLPYHESPHFAKMVTILHIEYALYNVQNDVVYLTPLSSSQNNHFSFLLPYKSAAKPLSRIALVSEMLKSSDLTRFVISLLPEAFTGIGAGLHRTLVCFNTSVMLEYITRASTAQLNAETVAMILPSLLTPLGQPSKDVKGSFRKDCLVSCNPPKHSCAPFTEQSTTQLGSFVLLSALSHRCRFSPAALTLIVKSMVLGTASAISDGAGADAHQLLTALTSVLSPHDTLDELPMDVANEFVTIK